MIKFKKNDQVKITAGKDRGQTGAVINVLPKDRQLIVKGKNVYKKHVKSQDKSHPGGIIEKYRPLSFAKVALICPKCSQVTRVGFQVMKDGKVRVCRKCKQQVD